jgi:hypothetical protein
VCTAASAAAAPEWTKLHYTEVFGDLPTNAVAAEKVTSSNALLAPILEAGAGAVPTPFTGAWSEVRGQRLRVAPPDGLRRHDVVLGEESAGVHVAGGRARAGVDAVAVCVPSGLHADVAVPALEAGKHTVIEKPIDVTVAAARRVAEAAAAAGEGVVTAVISQHRFDPGSQVVQRAIAEGRLGRLTSAVASLAWWRGRTTTTPVTGAVPGRSTGAGR